MISASGAGQPAAPAAPAIPARPDNVSPAPPHPAVTRPTLDLTFDGLRTWPISIYEWAMMARYIEINAQFTITRQHAVALMNAIKSGYYAGKKFYAPTHTTGVEDGEEVYRRLMDKTSGEYDRKRRLRKNITDAINAGELDQILRQDPAVRVPRELHPCATPRLVEEIYTQTAGWNVLEPYLERDEIDSDEEIVTEIMVNRYDDIYIERYGKLERANARFASPGELRNFARRLAEDAGAKPSTTEPTTDLSLPDGSRVNIVQPPITQDGRWVITIRRFPSSPWRMPALVANGTLSQEIANLLQDITDAEANLIVVGATGSGKTSLLNAIINMKDGRKRLVSIEDTRELSPDPLLIPNYVPMLTSLHRTTQDLVKNSLRMRADYLIVGETRDATAYDMLMAMNTGTLGSASTTHAYGAFGGLKRLTMLARMVDSPPPEEITRNLVIDAIHLIISIARYADGSRHVSSIDEIIPKLYNGEFQTRNIFRCVPRRHEDGHYTYEFRHNASYRMHPRLVDFFHLHHLDWRRWNGTGPEPAADAPLTEETRLTDFELPFDETPADRVRQIELLSQTVNGVLPAFTPGGSV